MYICDNIVDIIPVIRPPSELAKKWSL